jgi:hypothetical protein
LSGLGCLRFLDQVKRLDHGLIQVIDPGDDPGNYWEWVITTENVVGGSLIFLEIRHDVDIPVTELQVFPQI